MSQKSEKSLKRDVLSLVGKDPPQDSNLIWIFGLELSVLGEKLEHWFFNQLLPLKDDILQDTVVLSSVNFMTNIRKKMHREADFLIISWPRKLIISIEMKRSLQGEKVFNQLDLNHQIFEERLGDRLQHGWTFFPMVCVEQSTVSSDSLHYMKIDAEIKTRLQNIFHLFPVIPMDESPTPLDDVKQLLQIILFAVHVSKKHQIAPITNSNWVEYISNAIDNVSTCENIIFYSNQQISVLNDSSSAGLGGQGRQSCSDKRQFNYTRVQNFKGRSYTF